MKSEQRIQRKTSLREKLDQAVKDISNPYETETPVQESKKDPHRKGPIIDPYVKVGLYITGAFVLIWASQYALAALAGVVRQYKNFKKAMRE